MTNLQSAISSEKTVPIRIDNGEFKQISVRHLEENSAVTFQGNSNISVENSNEVVIGSLTQFIGPVTIMNNNNDKKVLTDNEITNTDKGIPSNIDQNTYYNEITPIWINKKRCIFVFVIIALPVIFITVSVSLATNRSYERIKDRLNVDALAEDRNDSAKNLENGEKETNSTLFRNMVQYVLITHSDGRKCNTSEKCLFTVQYHQNFHSHSVKYGPQNFGHNFFIGGDGSFYLDRGWNVKNNVSDNNIELSFMGNYNRDYLTTGMINSAKILIKFGIKIGVISPDYILVAHNQTYNNTDSPGSHVYEEITKWPHWKKGYFANV